MKSVALIFFFALVGIAAWPMMNGKLMKEDHSWKAPSKGDVRSPCPVLNTLANHGFLPRDGKNITKSQFVSGLENGLNLGGDIANVLAAGALSAFGASAIDLSTLQKHNEIEHDSSLSRLDHYLGDSTVLNPGLLKSLLNASTDGKIITWENFVTYRRARQADSKANNPQWLFNLKQQAASAGEVAAFVSVFGNWFKGVSVENTRSVFQNERFPSGWKKPWFPVYAAEVLPRAAQVEYEMMKP